MVAINLKEKFRNGELDLSSCGLKEIPKDIVSIYVILFIVMFSLLGIAFEKHVCIHLELFLLQTSLKHITGLNLSNNKIASVSVSISPVFLNR